MSLYLKRLLCHYLLLVSTLTFGVGWHEWEWEQNGHDWWRWTDRHGKIQVMTAEGGNLRIQGDIYSIRSPHRVDVLVNGERVGIFPRTVALWRSR